jgi:hypothetical protein
MAQIVPAEAQTSRSIAEPGDGGDSSFIVQFQAQQRHIRAQLIFGRSAEQKRQRWLQPQPFREESISTPAYQPRIR